MKQLVAALLWMCCGLLLVVTPPFQRPVRAASAALTVDGGAIDIPVMSVSYALVIADQSILSGATVDAPSAKVTDIIAELAVAGLAANDVRWWMQSSSESHVPLGQLPTTLGIVMVRLGTPAQARFRLPALEAKARALGLLFASNAFVGVDCDALTHQTDEALRAAAQRRISLLSEIYQVPAVLQRTERVAPATGTFDPVLLCSDLDRPHIDWVSDKGLPPFDAGLVVVRVRGNAEVSLREGAARSAPMLVPVPAGSSAVFPYSSFMFPSLHAHDKRIVILGSGGVLAAPGSSQVTAPIDAVVLHLVFGSLFGWTQPMIEQRVRDLITLGVDPQDIVAPKPPPAPVGDHSLYVRVRPLDRLHSILQAVEGATNTEEYRFIGNCMPYRRYALSLAIRQSFDQAKAAASVTGQRFDTLIAQTDWSGETSNAICGLDQSASTPALIAAASESQASPSDYDTTATFWDNVYVAWGSAGGTPTVTTQGVARGDAPVSVGSGNAHAYSGSAIVQPQAFAVEGWVGQNVWQSQIVASKAGETASSFRSSLAPAHGQNRPPGVQNVVTDCATAQQQALQNAVRAGLALQAVQSIVVGEPAFASVLCLAPNLIGYSGQNMFFYIKDSDTGLPTISVPIRVYP